MGAVSERLTITLAEAKNYLRVESDVTTDDTLIQGLIDSAKLSADAYLNNPFEYVYRERIGRADGATTEFSVIETPVFVESDTVYVAGIQQTRDVDYSIDYQDGTITFTTAPAAGLVEASYEAELPIPMPIKTWCLQRVARAYQRRTEGLEAEALTGLGSTTWGGDDYSLLGPYRQLVGL